VKAKLASKHLSTGERAAKSSRILPMKWRGFGLSGVPNRDWVQVPSDLVRREQKREILPRNNRRPPIPDSQPTIAGPTRVTDRRED